MYTGWLSSEFSGSTVNELINNSLALSSEKEALTERWTSALFTYPFIHFELGEFVLSMLMLWIFGHILSQRVGVGRVLFLYALFTILAGIAFNVSHIIFPVFSGLGGTMEGAFAPVLGIMSATAVLMNKRRLYIGSVASISLLQLYAFCLLIGLFVACKNNIAYVMAYLICIYAGLLFAIILHFKETKGLE